MDTPISRHPTNPLVLIREELNLSQDDLANAAGITRQIVTTTEAGVFSDIPPAILNALKDDFGIPAAPLNDSYRHWIKAELNTINVSAITYVTRTPVIGENGIVEKDIVEITIPVGITTFREWRAALSQDNGIATDSLSGFGKLIKVQPVLIRKYESGKTKSLPGPLVERLLFWGFSEAYLSELAGLPIGCKVD